MARPTKKGIDYFQADVDMFQDRKIKRLLRSAGSKGFTVYIYLLTCIYRDEGYLYEWDEHSAFDISDDLNFSESVVEESVRACCSIGLFNEDLYSAQSVLTSESIQDRWQKIVKDAKRTDTSVEPVYKLPKEETELIQEETQVNLEETLNNSEFSTQRKVKESKEKNTKRERACEDTPGDYSSINNTPLPDAFQNSDFVEQYRKYMNYMKTGKWKTVVTPAKTEQDIIELFRLSQSGNDPVAVIRQTIIGDNKSFYPLKQREFNKSGSDDAQFDPEYARRRAEAVPG